MYTAPICFAAATSLLQSAIHPHQKVSGSKAFRYSSTLLWIRVQIMPYETDATPKWEWMGLFKLKSTFCANKKIGTKNIRLLTAAAVSYCFGIFCPT